MTVVVDERIAERRARIRSEDRRRRLRRTLFAVFAVVLLGAAVAIERSDLVALAEVRVIGIDRLDADAVRDAAALELGTSTLRLRLGKAEERVERLPLVLDAEAERIDPLTVAITVTERVPLLTVAGRGGAVLVDREGQVIDDGARDDLPRIELDGRPPSAGATVAADPGLDAAFAAATRLPGPLRAQITRYVVGRDGQLSLWLTSGVEVRLGDADRLDEKARALGAVVEDLGGEQVSVIDVRAPSTPTVRP